MIQSIIIIWHTGSLRANLIYPLEEVNVAITTEEDDRLSDILNRVGLGYLKNRWTLDHEANWADLLSGGEQQRLGIARVFYHKPTYALLDEGTSALDSAMEAQCMQQCQLLGITLISVGHRPALLAYHQQRLHISRDGTYRLDIIPSDLHQQAEEAAKHAATDDAPVEEFKKPTK
jgi:ABC-type uncharacterized transport system fused permease/ATPase subunit